MLWYDSLSCNINHFNQYEIQLQQNLISMFLKIGIFDEGDSSDVYSDL
jgi:hypothetical protein